MKSLHLALATLLIGVLYVHAAPNLDASPTAATPSSTTTCPASPTESGHVQPPTTTDRTQWSNAKYIEEHMILATNTSVFWMGRVPDTKCSVREKAERCAFANDRVTIGMAMYRNGFIGAKPPQTGDPSYADDWNHLVSQVFAEHTSGVAWAISGNFTSTSDYLQDEFPALIRNTKVTAVLGIHPETCKPFCFWYCPRNSPLKECQDFTKQNKFCYGLSPWP